MTWLEQTVWTLAGALLTGLGLGVSAWVASNWRGGKR